MLEQFHVGNLPNELKTSYDFNVWRYESRTDGRGQQYQAKVPYNPNTHKRGDSSDPATFADFGTALAKSGAYDGMGIGVFGDLAGIDIDHCVNEDGSYSELAQQIVERMGAYTEVSPSGTGLRILCRASELIERYDRDSYRERYMFKDSELAPGLEIYIAGMTKRFLTVTGNGSGEFGERSRELQGILDEFMQRPRMVAAPTNKSVVIDLGDEALLEKARHAQDGARFAALYDVPEGWRALYPSQSNADLALCNMLAFWTGRDTQRMDALFRSSALYRPKWERQDYRAGTLQKAVTDCPTVYTGSFTVLADDGTPEVNSVPTETEFATVTTATEAKANKDAFEAFMDRIQTAAYRPMSTGIREFDDLLGGGPMAQELIVLQAPPAIGKTILASVIGESMAKAGRDVLYLNLEMSREYMYARSLSRITYGYGHRMSTAQILRGYGWTEEDRTAVEMAANSYRNTVAQHMHYNPDGCGTDLASIEATLERYATEADGRGLQAPPVILDYLHLVTGEGMDAQELVKRTVAMLKGYAIEHNTFAIAIAATNRQANMTGRQSQSSGRDSSAIEYTADVQLAMNYAALADHEKTKDGKRRYNADDPNDMAELMDESPRRLVVQVLKNRMGAAGRKLYLDFYAEYGYIRAGKKRI